MAGRRADRRVSFSIRLCALIARCQDLERVHPYTEVFGIILAVDDIAPTLPVALQRFTVRFEPWRLELQPRVMASDGAFAAATSLTRPCQRPKMIS
jgi:hypothetical protein